MCSVGYPSITMSMSYSIYLVDLFDAQWKTLLSGSATKSETREWFRDTEYTRRDSSIHNKIYLVDAGECSPVLNGLLFSFSARSLFMVPRRVFLISQLMALETLVVYRVGHNTFLALNQLYFTSISFQSSWSAIVIRRYHTPWPSTELQHIFRARTFSGWHYRSSRVPSPDDAAGRLFCFDFFGNQDENINIEIKIGRLGADEYVSAKVILSLVMHFPIGT